MRLITSEYAYSYEKLHSDSVIKAEEAFGDLSWPMKRSLRKKDTNKKLSPLGSGVVLLLVAGGLYNRNRIYQGNQEGYHIRKSVTGQKVAPEYPSCGNSGRVEKTKGKLTRGDYIWSVFCSLILYDLPKYPFQNERSGSGC